tara:strand:- start:621 stop:848 length:228 start_codon:yes stop_codon:yes gene_type:complete
MEYFSIKRGDVTPAPEKENSRSQWRQKFESMGVGDWFEVSEDQRGNVATNANLYVKGKYSLYRVGNGYIFKIKSN